MHEVIMCEEIIGKYFGIFSNLKGYDSYQLFPISINSEIFPYLKYFKRYMQHDVVLTKHCQIIEDYNKSDKIISNYEKYYNKRGSIYDFEKVIFEFETEEEAFYFKLKFC